MIVELEIDGRVHLVTVEVDGPADAAGGSFCVTIAPAGGVSGSSAVPQTLHVAARSTDLGLSLLYRGDHRSVDAAVTARPGGETLVQLPHVDVRIVADGRRYRQADAAGGGSGEQRLSAPMPGRVLRVLVKTGDEVVAGQPAVVIEAMKMENEMRVPRAGRVREVHVQDGASVEAGRLLLVVE